MTLNKFLKYRYIYYLNMVVLYIAIVYFFQYLISPGEMTFILLVFIALSEGIIAGHGNDAFSSLEGTNLPLVFLPLAIMVSFLTLTSIFSYSKIYKLNFDTDKIHLSTISGKVVKEYDHSHYVVVNNKGNLQHFLFDYPQGVLQETDIYIPEGEHVSVKYMTTKQRTPDNKKFYQLAYDIRSHNKVYLDSLSSSNRYSQRHSLAMRNMPISLLLYCITALANYIIFSKFLKS